MSGGPHRLSESVPSDRTESGTRYGPAATDRVTRTRGREVYYPSPPGRASVTVLTIGGEVSVLNPYGGPVIILPNLIIKALFSRDGDGVGAAGGPSDRLRGPAARRARRPGPGHDWRPGPGPSHDLP
eukprot:385954-Hanusia_phi.AAC.1